MKRRVLFADDEPRVLTSIRRMLHSKRSEWEMRFVENGPEALSLLAEEPIDVIVTDMRMPGMDGAQLLAEVKKSYPHMVRIVLSGQSDKEMIFKSVGLAHQYLSKPCDAEVLKTTVGRACALREFLSHESLKSLVSKLDSLPSLPSLYAKIMDELRKEDTPIQKIGEIIAQDIGMTAKILQLVNSAFFGMPKHIENPGQAVNLLGLDTVKALVLTVEVFSEIEPYKLNNFEIEGLWTHSFKTGELAKRIAKAEEADKQMANDAYIAGLLHDVGKLILIDRLADEYKKVIELAQKEKIMLCDAEIRRLGASHADVGAYLMGLWGMTDSIVEAVAFHHNPQCCTVQTFSPLTIVHVANLLEKAGKKRDTACPKTCAMATDYIAAMDLTKRIPIWQNTYGQMLQEKK